MRYIIIPILTILSILWTYFSIENLKRHFREPYDESLKLYSFLFIIITAMSTIVLITVYIIEPAIDFCIKHW